jgi:ubiquinone/menaquinone biosynthesis C-methylase UbiE
VPLRLRLDRWYLGLHGLALLRSYPYGDPAEAEERMTAMRSLLQGDGDPETFVAEEFDVLGLDDAYASWSVTYDDPNPLIAAEERALLPILDRAEPGVAVDAATGTGRVAAHLQGRGHRVLACDRSEGMLRRASDRLGGTSIVQADLLHLPVRDGSVDLVTCSLALTHVERLPPAFESFGRVVRPGGLAVISDIHPFAVATGAQAFFRREDGSRAVVRNEQHWVSDYVAAGTAAGFAIEGCEEVFIDEALLSEFAPDGYAEAALLGLPFGLIWRLRRR